MKKQSLLWVCFLAGIIVFSSCGGGNKDKTKESTAGNKTESATNLPKNGFNGNIKSVRQRVYWALKKFGRMEKGKLQNLPQHDFLKVYNEHGLLTEETHFDAKDEVVSRRVNTYNKTKLMKEEFFDAKKCTSIIEYSYEGNLVKQKDIEDGEGKLKERYIYSYYDYSKLVQDEDKYNASGKLTQKIVHVYEGTKVSEKQYYTGGGYPFKKEYYSYDEDGNLSVVTRNKYQNKEEIYDGKTEYSEHNSFGDYRSKITYDKMDQQIEIARYVYDEHGNLLEYTVSKPKKTEAVATISEAESAEITPEVSSYSEEGYGEVEQEWALGSGAAYEYTYDNLFNWIIKITYKIDEATGKKNRQFFYECTIEYR